VKGENRNSLLHCMVAKNFGLCTLGVFGVNG
jgi:ATP sulfurylase